MGGVALLLTDCGGCTYPLPRVWFLVFYGSYLSQSFCLDHRQGIDFKRRTFEILDRHNQLCETDTLSELVLLCIWVTSQLQIEWRRDRLYQVLHGELGHSWGWRKTQDQLSDPNWA